MAKKMNNIATVGKKKKKRTDKGTIDTTTR